MNLSCHRRNQTGGGWGRKRLAPQIEMPPMIKTIAKPNVSSLSVSFSIFAYNSIRAQQTNTKIDDQVARAPSNQIFANQFKCITREKFRIFVLKVVSSVKKLKSTATQQHHWNRFCNFQKHRFSRFNASTDLGGCISKVQHPLTKFLCCGTIISQMCCYSYSKKA